MPRSGVELCRAGQTRVAAFIAKWAPRAGKRWAEEIFSALGEKTVAGTGAAGVVLPFPMLRDGVLYEAPAAKAA